MGKPRRRGSGQKELRVACPVCERWEREYEATIRAIYAVVSGRFDSIGEKLRELHRLQDLRDVALKKYYEHKKTHPRRCSDGGQAA
jgi:hypothetical protein